MIRDARADDAASIAAFWNPMIRDTAVTFNAAEKPPAEIAAMIRTRQAAGHGFLVAEGDGHVMGFCTYAQFRGGVGYARTMEHTIILAPESRGRGMGRALIDAACTHARDRDVHAMIAGVSAENPGGVTFHAAMGFAHVATLPQVGYKFGRFMDLVLMQKILT